MVVELEVLEVLKPRLKSGVRGLQCAQGRLVFFYSLSKASLIQAVPYLGFLLKVLVIFFQSSLGDPCLTCCAAGVVSQRGMPFAAVTPTRRKRQATQPMAQTVEPAPGHRFRKVVLHGT